MVPSFGVYGQCLRRTSRSGGLGNRGRTSQKRISIEFNQKAKRPNYSFLSSDKLKKEFGLKLPNWEESIKEVITENEKK